MKKEIDTSSYFHSVSTLLLNRAWNVAWVVIPNHASSISSVQSLDVLYGLGHPVG